MSGSDWTVADSLRSCFVSENVDDSNGEPANVVDVISQVTGGMLAGCERLTALVKATNNVAAGLHAIAEAIKSTSKSNDNK
jgi:hypothetical protein